MTGYLLRRLFQSLVVVVVVTIIVFLLLQQLPGGPVRAILGPRASAPQIAAFKRENGLDKPVVIQYFVYLGHWFTGNFGYSYNLNQSVGSLIANRLPKTLILNGLALLLTIIVAIPAGIYQAVRRNKPFDYVATTFSFIFYAAPTYFLGLVAIIVFSLKLGWLPAEAPQSESITGIFADWKGLVLPVVVLALLSIAGFSRYMRSSVLDNINLDYVRTARAKGASGTRVLWRHVLRNALIPIVTLIGLSLPALFAGSLVTESVFNYPGMGFLFFTQATKNDFPTELGIVLVVAIATVVGNLIADIAYAIIDPRVRLT